MSEFPAPPEGMGLEPFGDSLDLYVVGPTREGPLKIGVAKDSHSRLCALQTGSPWPLKLFVRFIIKAEQAAVERAVHRDLAEFRCSGEWFDVPLEVAMIVIMYALSRADVHLSGSSWDTPVCLILDHPEANPTLWPEMFARRAKQKEPSP